MIKKYETRFKDSLDYKDEILEALKDMKVNSKNIYYHNDNIRNKVKKIGLNNALCK